MCLSITCEIPHLHLCFLQSVGWSLMGEDCYQLKSIMVKPLDYEIIRPGSAILTSFAFYFTLMP